MEEGLQASLTDDVTLQRNSISSPMLHPDWVIWTNPKKKNKKKRNNSNSLANVENVTLQRNLTGSDMRNEMTAAAQGKKMKKKKNRNKGGNNLNALADVNLVQLQHPVVATCLVTDSRLDQCHVQVEDCDNIRNKSNLSSSNDTNIAGSNSGLIVDSRSTLQVKVDQVPESNVNPLSIIVEHNDQVCSNNGSKELCLDAPLNKKKRKKKKKNLNTTLASSVIIPSTSVMDDPKSMQHTTEHLVSQGIHQNKYATKDRNCSVEVSSGIIDAKVNKISVSQDMDPFHKVAGDDDLARGVESSAKVVMVPLQEQKTKRKKKKKNLNTLVSSVIMPSTSVMGDPELMQHSTEQGVLQGIHQNECATNDKNCSGEDSSGIVDAKVDEIAVSHIKAVGNIYRGEKRKTEIRGNNLNLETEEGVISSNDLLEEQQVKRAKLNADQNVGIGRMLPGSVQKILLVLDLNGLLVDVVGDNTVTVKADGHVAGKKIFKRPFCEDFLQFCFNRFTVGVWSSRRKENVDKVLQVLMPEEDRSKLAFVWNQSHCTRTGFQTLEHIGKPLFLKELPKLWKNENRKFSLKVVDYDKSNTLLLDDSPYKALLNPPYTAIFPTPYQYQDQNDDGLAGPGGDLRVYLEGLALAEDVQEYVEQNPFGQKPIIKSDPSWSFYAEVIRNMSKKRRRKRYRKKRNPYLENGVASTSKSVPV